MVKIEAQHAQNRKRMLVKSCQCPMQAFTEVSAEFVCHQARDEHFAKMSRRRGVGATGAGDAGDADRRTTTGPAVSQASDACTYTRTDIIDQVNFTVSAVCAAYVAPRDPLLRWAFDDVASRATTGMHMRPSHTHAHALMHMT